MSKYSSKYRCIYIVTHFLMASHVETYSASRGLLLKCSHYIISIVIQTYQAEQMQNSKIQVLSTDHFLKSILFGAGLMYIYIYIQYIYIYVCVYNYVYTFTHIFYLHISILPQDEGHRFPAPPLHRARRPPPFGRSSVWRSAFPRKLVGKIMGATQ